LLVGEENIIPKGLEIISFPTIKMKGIIKFLKIEDPEARGGFINGTITLFFKEKDDTIFYKYMKNFEKIFDQFAVTISILEKRNANAREFITLFNEFSNEVSAILKELFEEEMGTKENIPFPKEVTPKKLRLFSYKLIVCGDPEVGKTSTILRYTDDAFRRTYIMTMGINVSTKSVILENKKVTFAIWDRAGQTKIQMTRRHFYEGAQAQLLVFDLTRPQTMENIRKWYDDIKDEIKQEIPCVILANKADLIDERKIETPVIKQISTELGIPYLETSAKSGKNINKAFQKLAWELVKDK
jgi:small GTP-binding protein